MEISYLNGRAYAGHYEVIVVDTDATEANAGVRVDQSGLYLKKGHYGN